MGELYKQYTMIELFSDLLGRRIYIVDVHIDPKNGDLKRCYCCYRLVDKVLVVSSLVETTKPDLFETRGLKPVWQFLNCE